MPVEEFPVSEPLAAAPPIRLEGVTKRYGRRTVLDRVSLDVPAGITGLVGPNGAGKSTLVRAILGLVRLAAGSVRVHGLDPAADPHRVRRLTGVVPEDDAAVPGLSGVEMVQYAARLSGLPATEGLRRAHEVLDWCDAGQERYRAIETLSVGMRQKVAFAAAIVHDPAIVILDEPTNGLDPLERRAMLGRLVSLAADHGKTILVSTHVLRDVQSICDRLVLLVQGVALPGALLVGWLAERFGRRTALVGCLTGWMAVLVLAWFVRTAAQLHALAVLLALVLGGVQSVIRATVADAAPAGRAGVAFGLLQVGSKLAGAAAGLLFGWLYLASGLPRAGLAALLVQLVAGWWFLRRMDGRGPRQDSPSTSRIE
ncbi:MAG: MFS transporter [Planctomycetia bacterium]|nr:MFS transporter [Planctomycetia bacterium]